MTDTKHTKDNVKVGDIFIIDHSSFTEKSRYEVLYVGEETVFVKSLINSPKYVENMFTYGYLDKYTTKAKKTIKAEPKYVPIWNDDPSGARLGHVTYTKKEMESAIASGPSPLIIDWIEINYEKEV